MSTIIQYVIGQAVSSSFFLAIVGYYHPDNQNLLHARYCRWLGHDKQLEAISLLMRLNENDFYLHAALVAALPPDRAVAHLENVERAFAASAQAHSVFYISTKVRYSAPASDGGQSHQSDHSLTSRGTSRLFGMISTPTPTQKRSSFKRGLPDSIPARTASNGIAACFA
jgi:hypothetical protein